MEKTEESLHSLMEAQRQYYLKGCTKNINMRLAYLKKLEQEIKRNSELIVRALKDDFNKPEFEAYTTEIMPVLDDIALFLKKLPAWSGLQRVKTPIKLMAGSSGFSNLPFGGIGHSGMGDYHGRWSFEAFSHKKAVFKKTELLDFSFIYPPYKNKAALIKKWLFSLNQDNY